MNDDQKDMEIKKAVYERMKKSTIVAFFLWLFFGSIGVHRFYLHRNLSVGLFLLTSIICYIIFFLALVINDFNKLFALFIIIPAIWLLVDLFLLRSMTAEYNFRIHKKIINYRK